MIVTCNQCQTRFKIADEKVTDRGVKVRCTRCQNTFRVKRDGAHPIAASPAPSTPAELADPFSQFAPADPAFERPTRPGLFPAGVEASKSPDFEPLAPSYEAQKNLPDEIFESPTRVGPVPSFVEPVRTPTQPSVPAWNPPAQPLPSKAWMPQPSSLESESEAIPLPAPSRPSPVVSDEFDGVEMTEGFGAASKPYLPPAAPAPPPRPSVPVRSAAPVLSAAPAPALPPPALKPPPPVLTPSPSVPVAPFRPPVLTATPVLEPLPLRQPPPPPVVDTEDEEPTVRWNGEPGPKAPRPQVAPPVVEVARPAARKSSRAIALNFALGAIWVVVLAVVGAIYINDGKLDSSTLSLQRIKGLIAPPRAMVVLDVSNGLYETRIGKPVFLVRGEVENRTGRPGKARVRAELLYGRQSIRAVDGFAGAAPSPEDLYAISSAADADALNARLEKAAVNLGPGARSPFLVTFYDYPPELSDFRVKVSVVEGEAKETAAR